MSDRFEVKIKEDHSYHNEYVYLSVSFDGMVWNSLLLPSKHLEKVIATLEAHKAGSEYDPKD